MHQAHKHPTITFIVNTSTIQVAENSGPTRRRELIDVRHHHLQHHIKRANIVAEHIPTAHNPADLFIKGLGPIHFREICQIIQPPTPCSTDPTAHPSSSITRTAQRPSELTDRNSHHQTLTCARVTDGKDRLSGTQSVIRGT